MTHYKCEACGGSSDVPGLCTTDGYGMNGQALKECNCEGGKEAHMKTEE